MSNEARAIDRPVGVVVSDAGEAPLTRAEVAPPPPATRSRRHLHQIDLVRLLTFACVIGVHGIPMATSGSSAGAGALVVLLHFTRNAFFLLSAFVLFFTYARKEIRVRSFWAHRFFYIGVPYVVWTVVYWWINAGGLPSSLGDLGDLGFDLVAGTGEYHLYFLLVSMQLYLAFPLLLWLVRRTAGHHLALFWASLVLELVLMSLPHWWHWSGGWAAVQAHDYVFLPMYEFYFVAGGLAAIHYERFHGWVVGHSRAVVAIVAGGLLLQEGTYAAQLLTSGGNTGYASDPIQPSMVPWSLALTLGFYALGVGYARRRRADSRMSRFIDQASLASFGVYLVHPLFLNVILGRWLAYGSSSLPPSAAAALAWVGTLVLSFAFAAVVIRTPLALPLTGRRRLRSPAGAAA